MRKTGLTHAIAILTLWSICSFHALGLTVNGNVTSLNDSTVESLLPVQLRVSQSKLESQAVSPVNSTVLENASREVVEEDGNRSVQAEDSVTPGYHDLEEIVVIASRETRLKDGIAYTPDKKQKKFSNDGVSLLARMMIPSLRVNLMDKSVQTTSGNEVRFFINGLPASQEEVDALYPEDVNKVEILDYPSDARFLGAEHVINYIVTKYLWGGYTKVSANVSGPAWRGGGFLNSGLTYKRMTYNLYVNSNYSQDFTNSHSVLTLNLDGEKSSIETTNYRPKGRTTNETGYFSALYQTDRVRFKNKISFSHALTPWQTRSGMVIYESPSETIEALSHSATHSKTLTPAWEGNLTVNFPNNFSLGATASTLFRINNSRQVQDEYRDGDLIFNNDYRVKETGNRSEFNVYLQKNFSDTHSFLLKGFGTYNIYNLKYKGTVGDDSRLEDIYSMLAATYIYRWNTGRISFEGRANYTKSDIRPSDFGINKWTPGGSIAFTLNPRQNQQIEASVVYAQGAYPLAQINPTRIQRNLLIWEEGNPNLDNPSSFLFNFNYKWWNPKLYVYVYLNGELDFNTMYQSAYQNRDMQGITLCYDNGVNWRDYYLGTSITWNISKEFAVSGWGTVLNFNKTAPVNHHKYRARGGVQGQWSHNNYLVYVSLSSATPLQGFTGYYRRDMNYNLGVVATYGNWNLNLSVNNPFKRNKNMAEWGGTPNNLYSYNTTTYSRLSTTDISLSVTYTIRYGRRQQNQNIEGITNDQSLMK